MNVSIVVVDCHFQMIVFTFDSHLPQFIDRANDIGGRWNRFNKRKDMNINFKCPAKSILMKAFLVFFCGLVCFVSEGGLYRERVLSAISAFNLGATADTYSTLSCNTDTENALQCLVHMQPLIPETRNCDTVYGNVNHSLCGRFLSWMKRLVVPWVRHADGSTPAQQARGRFHSSEMLAKA